MLKRFHLLIKNKGFMLEQMFVGLLAAVMIPTMAGMTVKSRVTSADATAQAVCQTINSFLADADTMNCGMKTDSSAVDTFTITARVRENITVWSITGIDTELYKTNGKYEWRESGSAIAGHDARKSADLTERLCGEFAEFFPNITSATIKVAVKGGRCTAAAYTAENFDLIEGVDYPLMRNGEFPGAFEWNGSTAGVSKRGLVVGTYPKADIY